MATDKLSQELDEFNQQRVYEELINAWTGSADWINELDKIEIPLPNDALIEAAQQYKENVSAGTITSSNGLTSSPSTSGGICSTSTTTWKGGYVTNNFESYYMDENGNKHINNK